MAQDEETHYGRLERELEEAPMSYVPALLATIIQRCAREPIFNGWVGLHAFIQRVWVAEGGESGG